MPYLYRPKYTKAVPQGAEIVEQRGKRFARWSDGAGRTRTAPVRTMTDGTEMLSVASPRWRLRYRDGSGAYQDVATGCADKSAAERFRNEVVRAAELVRARVLTPAEAATASHAPVPLPEHVDRYLDHLRAKGCTTERVARAGRGLRRLAADCAFTRLTDLDAAPAERWLADRAKAGLSAAARNGYRQLLVGFGNWCRKTRRLVVNPFQDLPTASVRSDRRRVRRALTSDELRRLLKVAQQRPITAAQTIRSGRRKGQSIARLTPRVHRHLRLLGLERALIYKMMVLTGIRKRELASITVADVILDRPEPHLILSPRHEKNRRGSTIPLRADLVNDLKSWLAVRLEDLRQRASRRTGNTEVPTSLPPDAKLVRIPGNLSGVLLDDLLAAGLARLVTGPEGKRRIDSSDDRGRVIDVHALRMTFASHLAAGGVPLRTAQAALRHSRPELTAVTYTDPKLLDVAGSLRSLPGLPLRTTPMVTDRATPCTAAPALDSRPATASTPVTGSNRRTGHSPANT